MLDNVEEPIFDCSFQVLGSELQIIISWFDFLGKRARLLCPSLSQLLQVMDELFESFYKIIFKITFESI